MDVAAPNKPESRRLAEEAASRRRYSLAAYSTIASIVSKGLSLVVLYVSVPMTISYLGAERFGVWMTLASFISFLGFLDFGIGSSLLNEVAHVSATGTRARLKRLITHGLVLLAAIGLALAAVLLIAVQFVPLQAVFNVGGKVDPREFHDAAVMLIGLIGLSVPVVGLQRVFWGLQRAFVYHLLVGAGNVISLCVLFVVARHHGSIDQLLLATYGVQLLATLPLAGVLVARNMIGAFGRREFYADARTLLQHGTLFFILAIGGAVGWDSDFIIISHIVGPAAVAVYAVAVRLFQLVELPLQMANAPLWSAYADAAARGSYAFLRTTLRRAVLFTFLAAFLCAAFLVVFRVPVTRIWIHGAVTVPATLILLMSVWITLRAVGNAFAMYLNGVRIVAPQVFVVVTFCAVALPLKILGTWEMGASGLVLAGMASYLLCTVIPYLTWFKSAWTAPLKGI